MKDVERALIRRHGITKAEMKRSDQVIKKYINQNNIIILGQFLTGIRSKRMVKVASLQSPSDKEASLKVSSGDKAIIEKTPWNKKLEKKGCLIAIILFLFVLVGCQSNTNTDTDKSVSTQKATTSVITERPTPDKTIVESSPTIAADKDRLDLNNDKPTASGVSIEAAKETVTPENEGTDIQKIYQPVSVLFYDASDLKGRGLIDFTGHEPNYTDAIGYASVYTEAGLENNSVYTATPWTIPVYIRIDGELVPNGTIDHKTKIGIISQELTKQNGREYQGFLKFQDIETGQIGYINVKNFVTMPYWELDVSTAVNKGYCIAVFRQSSNYAPIYKNGKKATVKANSQVLLPARGTYYVSVMNRVDYQIVGIMFDTKNNEVVPQYVFFNKNDLQMIY